MKTCFLPCSGSRVCTVTDVLDWEKYGETSTETGLSRMKDCSGCVYYTKWTPEFPRSRPPTWSTEQGWFTIIPKWHGQLRTARSKCSLNDHQSLFTSARDTTEPNEFLVYSVLIKGNPSQEPSLLSTFPHKFLKSSARSYKRAFLRPQSTQQSLFSRYNFRLLSMNRWIIGPEKSKNRGLRSEHVRQRNPRYSQPCFAT